MKTDDKKWTSFYQKSHGSFKMAIHTLISNQSVILDAEVQLLRQLMCREDNADFDDCLGTNHVVVCCDVGQLTFDDRF